MTDTEYLRSETEKLISLMNNYKRCEEMDMMIKLRIMNIEYTLKKLKAVVTADYHL